MTTKFPDELDQFENPRPDSSQATARTHSQQHGDANDAIEALQRKVGINQSTDPHSLDYQVEELKDFVENINEMISRLSGSMPGPSGSAAIDTIILRSALAIGGEIRYTVPGVYQWLGASTIRSGTRISMASGVIWRQSPASRSPFLVNSGYSAMKATVQAMEVVTDYVDPDKSHSGINSYVRVSCVSHGFAKGEFVALGGAVEYGYDGCMRVCEVINPNEFIVETAVPVRASGASSDPWSGRLYASRADTNVSIDIQGDVDYNYRNLVAPIPADPIWLYTMGIVLYGVVNGSVSVSRFRNVAKYCVLAANVRNFDIHRINFDTHSDGVHFQPPFAGVRIGTLSGTTGDDLLSLTGGDFTSYEISRGHGYDIKVDHLMPQNALTALKVTGNSPHKFWDIGVGTISGSTILQGVSIIRDQNLTHTDIGKFRIDSMRVKPQTTEEFRMTMDSVDDLSIGDLSLMAAPVGRSVMPIGRATSYPMTIGSLTIERLSYAEAAVGRTIVDAGFNCTIGSVSIGLNGVVYTGATPLTLVNIEEAQSGGAPSAKIDTILLSGKVQSSSAAGRLVRQAGQLGTLMLSSLDYRRGENILHQVEGCSGLSDTNETRVLMDAVHLWETQYLIRAVGKVRCCFGGNYLQTPQPPIQAVVAGSEVTVEGCPKGTFSRATTRGAGTTVYINDPKIRADIVNHVTPRRGDSAYNVNTSFEYGECRVRYNGTRWVRDELNDGVQTPSDSTASSYNPDWTQGRTFRIPSLTQAVTFYGPNAASKLIPGDRVVFIIKQDGVGGRSVQFASAYYKFVTPFSLTGNVAGATTTVEFVYDGQYLVSTAGNTWI